MIATDHALLRMQQRGVSCDALEALITFGRIRRKGGVRIVYYDHHTKKAARQGYERERMSAQLADKLRSLYAVIGNNEKIITVSHRTKQFRFD